MERMRTNAQCKTKHIIGQQQIIEKENKEHHHGAPYYSYIFDVRLLISIKDEQK